MSQRVAGSRPRRKRAVKVSRVTHAHLVHTRAHTDSQHTHLPGLPLLLIWDKYVHTYKWDGYASTLRAGSSGENRRETTLALYYAV